MNEPTEEDVSVPDTIKWNLYWRSVVTELQRQGMTYEEAVEATYGRKEQAVALLKNILAETVELPPQLKIPYFADRCRLFIQGWEHAEQFLLSSKHMAGDVRQIVKDEMDRVGVPDIPPLTTPIKEAEDDHHDLFGVDKPSTPDNVIWKDRITSETDPAMTEPHWVDKISYTSGLMLGFAPGDPLAYWKSSGKNFLWLSAINGKKVCIPDATMEAHEDRIVVTIPRKSIYDHRHVLQHHPEHPEE